jgi:hypothetical protein
VEECSAGCGRRRASAWLEAWDEVRVEHATGTFRPDVALLREGRVVGAVEVFVTSSVSSDKASYFRDQQISWIEVEAREDLYSGAHPWTADQPLLFARAEPRTEPWVCQSCIERKEARRQADERALARFENAQRNYEDIHSAKMVDFYFSSGKKYREVYYAIKRVRNGEVVRTWVRTETNEVIVTADGPMTEETARFLNAAIKRRLHARQARGALVDEVVPWRPWKPGKKFVARDVDQFPFKFYWSTSERKWVKTPTAR